MHTLYQFLRYEMQDLQRKYTGKKPHYFTVNNCLTILESQMHILLKAPTLLLL